MAVLFLDPLVLAVVAAVAVHAWLVWRGTFTAWFGRPRGWVPFVWPLPFVTLAVLLLASSVSELLAATGLGDLGGGAATAAIYLGVYGVPWLWAGLAPPRWLFPRWARARIAPLPRAAASSHPGEVAAVHVPSGRGHAALTHWSWRVDGVPGTAHVAEGELRFRALEDDQLTDALSSRLDQQLEDDDIDQLQLELGAELRLQPPRGGWWTRRRFDVELDVVDTLDWRTRWTGHGGLLTLRVGDRRPLQLWVGDVPALRRQLEGWEPAV